MRDYVFDLDPTNYEVCCVAMAYDKDTNCYYPASATTPHGHIAYWDVYVIFNGEDCPQELYEEDFDTEEEAANKAEALAEYYGVTVDYY
jgi:hypothetical protein